MKKFKNKSRNTRSSTTRPRFRAQSDWFGNEATSTCVSSYSFSLPLDLGWRAAQLGNR